MHLNGSAAVTATLVLLASTAIALPHASNHIDVRDNTARLMRLAARADENEPLGSGSPGRTNTAGTSTPAPAPAPASPSREPYIPPPLRSSQGAGDSPAGSPRRSFSRPLSVTVSESPASGSPRSPSLPSGSPGRYIIPPLRNSPLAGEGAASPFSRGPKPVFGSTGSPSTSPGSMFGASPSAVFGSSGEPTLGGSPARTPDSARRARDDLIRPHKPGPFSPGRRRHRSRLGEGASGSKGASSSAAEDFPVIFEQSSRPPYESPPISRSPSPGKHAINDPNHNALTCPECAEPSTGMDKWMARQEKAQIEKEKQKSGRKSVSISEVLKKLDAPGSSGSPKSQSPKSRRLPRSLGLFSLPTRGATVSSPSTAVPAVLKPHVPDSCKYCQEYAAWIQAWREKEEIKKAKRERLAEVVKKAIGLGGGIKKPKIWRFPSLNALKYSRLTQQKI